MLRICTLFCVKSTSGGPCGMPLRARLPTPVGCRNARTASFAAVAVLSVLINRRFFLRERVAHDLQRRMVKFEAMTATTKFGIALMVLALLVFQPFSKCFGAPSAAMSHDCCPAPSKAECTMASCVCESTASTTTPIPASVNNAQPVAVLVSAAAHELTVSVRSAPERVHFRFALNDRFIVLHQFLI
jgi:hypothetical protein